jgi:AAA domain-containing protein
MSEVLEFSSPSDYSKENPIHMAIYARNGIGKTTLAGNAAKNGMRVTLLDCSDSGAVTLRNHPKEFLKIIRVRNILHYLDVIEQVIREADKTDLLVPDTLTGLQSLALREVKGKRKFDMNQRLWGLVGSRVIECIAETRNFPKDVLYLVQEKISTGKDDGPDEVSLAMTPSIKGYLSSAVDWVGRMTIEAVDNAKTGGVDMIRFLDFRITEFVEAKDRATLFPKRIKNPNYFAIRKRIEEQLNSPQGETNAEHN